MQGGHNCFVGYAVETGEVTESPDGIQPATLPPAPTSMAFVGRTNVPEQKRGLNNGLGYGIGSNKSQYRKRGTKTPSLTIALRAGSLGLLQKAMLVNGVLPKLCFWVGVPGVWTDIYRMAKIGNLQISGQESQTEAAEIMASLTIEAETSYALGAALSPSMAALAGLETPLFWHDVRGFSLTDSEGAVFPQRLNLISFQATINHNLAPGVSRPHWGDDKELSRTRSELKEMLLNVSGQMTLNKRLPDSLFAGTQDALAWGDIPLTISDVTQSKKLDLTFKNVIPQDETGAATEPSAPQSHTVPFMASDIEMNVVS